MVDDAAPKDPGADEAALFGLTERAPRLSVELHPTGRMRAPHPGARELLRDRLRDAELMPCGPGWLVLRTRDASGAEPPDARRVVAAGVLGDAGLSIIDFVGFLENGDETGMLSVAHGDVERSLYLREGAVVWAASTAPEDQLGALLVRRGRITAEQLSALRGDPASQDRIGAASVARGFVTHDVMLEMMRVWIVEIFDQILAMEHGVWSFARVPAELLGRAPVQIAAQGMLMDALRRIDEMQVYRQRVRSSKALVRRVGRAAAVDGPSTTDLVQRLEEGPLAGRVLDNLGTAASIEALVQRVGESEFAVTRAVYQLLRSNLVSIVEDEASARPAGPVATPEQAREIVEVYSIALREIFDEVARLGQASHLRTAARGFLADEAGAGTYAQLLRNVVLLPDGTLEDDSVLRGIATRPVTPRALNDALSELLFFVLYQATELLGRRRGDDLARRVKLIHAMLGVAEGEETP